MKGLRSSVFVLEVSVLDTSVWVFLKRRPLKRRWKTRKSKNSTGENRMDGWLNVFFVRKTHSPAATLLLLDPFLLPSDQSGILEQTITRWHIERSIQRVSDIGLNVTSWISNLESRVLFKVRRSSSHKSMEKNEGSYQGLRSLSNI